MEITLSISHFLVGGVFLVILAITVSAALQIKAMLDILSSIQARMDAGSRRLEKTRNHLETAEADITGMRQILGLVERASDESPEGEGAGVSVHLAEFKSALTLFKQQNLGRGGR